MYLKICGPNRKQLYIDTGVREVHVERRGPTVFKEADQVGGLREAEGYTLKYLMHDCLTARSSGGEDFNFVVICIPSNGEKPPLCIVTNWNVWLMDANGRTIDTINRDFDSDRADFSAPVGGSLHWTPDLRRADAAAETRPASPN